MTVAGWHPDPAGRFELRYHNGRSWTADVATGGQRYVDPQGARPTPPPDPSPASGDPSRLDGNGLATASMIIGIVAVSIAWMPLIVVLGVILAVVALALGVVGLRRAATGAGGRGTAIAGIATGGSALLVAVLGVVLSVIVLSEVDAYRSPNPNDTTIERCEVGDGVATASGSLTNLGSDAASFSVRVTFSRDGTDNAHRTARVDIDDVAPGATAEFAVDAAVDLDAVDCAIESVDGPLPFGIALE